MADEMKMEQLKKRLREGDVLRECELTGGKYVVHLREDPAIEFAESSRENVARVLHEYQQI